MKVRKMSCFSCMSSRRRDIIDIDDLIESHHSKSSSSDSRRREENDSLGRINDNIALAEHVKRKTLYNSKSGFGSLSKQQRGARSFTFRELSSATKNFNLCNLIGEGGFGKVYKGRIDTGQIVAIKQLDENSLQGNQEFIVEVLMLSLLHHPNLVTLIGYCADGDQRLLVYEFMPMGCLESHLYELDPKKEPLDWNTRMKIALGASRGLEYLHCKANPPVIYRDLKSANILLDENFNPKLSDFGLAKLGPVGDKTHVSTRVMGTYGYCAPEYAMSGKLTLKSDIYSFGVVMLELISGRKAMDPTKKHGEQSIIAWSRPFFRDRKKFAEMVDPRLKGCFPMQCLNHVLAITAMCLQEEPNFRPLISDIVVAFEYLVSQPYHMEAQSAKHSPTPSSYAIWVQEPIPKESVSRSATL